MPRLFVFFFPFFVKGFFRVPKFIVEDMRATGFFSAFSLLWSLFVGFFKFFRLFSRLRKLLALLLFFYSPTVKYKVLPFILSILRADLISSSSAIRYFFKKSKLGGQANDAIGNPSGIDSVNKKGSARISSSVGLLLGSSWRSLLIKLLAF